MSRAGVVGIVGLLLLSAGLFYFTGPSSVVVPPTSASTPDGVYPANDGVVVGVWECLPPTSKSGPQTAECALGLVKDGSTTHYGLDLAGVTEAAMQFSTGAHVQVEGTVVPTEALSTNYWQKYNMAGIIHVTSVTKL